MPLSIDSSGFPTRPDETPSIGVGADVDGDAVFGTKKLCDLKGLRDAARPGAAWLRTVRPDDDRDAGEATTRKVRDAAAAVGAVDRIDIRLENGSASDLSRPHEWNAVASVAGAVRNRGTGTPPARPARVVCDGVREADNGAG